MSCPILAPFISSFQFTKRISQGAVSSKSLLERQSPYTASIHILDDDSLLDIFCLYRSFFSSEEDRDVNIRFKGMVQWVGEHWWYRLAHVCSRWRNLILGSASYLGLCLVCTYGTPVAYMLAHSPPLPLVIDYAYTYRDITAEDEKAIILAIEQRDRVRHIRFGLPVLKLQKLIMAIDGDYPILEYLVLMGPLKDKTTLLTLPETLQTPHLRHLVIDCSIPIRSPLLTTAVGLVTLHLALHHKSTYFQPAVLLQSLSLMPQLEKLLIYFHFFVLSYDVERQPIHTSIMTNVMLPNLRFFALQAVNVYSEAVLSRITASRLKNIQICYPKQPTFSVPELLQFMGRTENLRFDRAKVQFDRKRVYVEVNPPENITSLIFSLTVHCWPLGLQIYSVAVIFNTLSQIFSVEHLTFAPRVYGWSSREPEVDRTEWRKLLRSFSNVKTLRVHLGLVVELSRCLQLDDGEHPLELLPELQELTYQGIVDPNVFTSFIDARQNAGRPVTLIKSRYCAPSKTN